jgi:hypothetical protein
MMIENLKVFPVNRADSSIEAQIREDQVSVSVELVRDRGKIERRLPRRHKLIDIRKSARRSERDLFGGRIRTQDLYKDRFFVSVFFEN